MIALAPLECRHPRLGQSLWRLQVMRPQCLHAHAAPAGVLVWPAGHPGEVFLPSVASSPRTGGRSGSGRRAPLCVLPPSHRCVGYAPFWGPGVVPPPPDLESSGWLCAAPGGAVGCVCVCMMMALSDRVSLPSTTFCFYCCMMPIYRSAFESER